MLNSETFIVTLGVNWPKICVFCLKKSEIERTENKRNEPIESVNKRISGQIENDTKEKLNKNTLEPLNSPKLSAIGLISRTSYLLAQTSSLRAAARGEGENWAYLNWKKNKRKGLLLFTFRASPYCFSIHPSSSSRLLRLTGMDDTDWKSNYMFPAGQQDLVGHEATTKEKGEVMQRHEHTLSLWLSFTSWDSEHTALTWISWTARKLELSV